MTARLALLILSGFHCIHAATLSAAEWQITVNAGDFDRRNTLVSFEAPEKLRGRFSLQNSEGITLPLQVDENGHAVFVERTLAKGKTRTYTITSPAKTEDVIKVEKAGDVVKVTSQPNGTQIFNYQTAPAPVPDGVPEAFKHGAYLHPVFSPRGRIVTANHPPDHLHQRGIFFAWTKTEFEGRHPDFWNMGKEQGGQFTGEVRFESLVKTWSGAVQGGFMSRHRFIDHTGGSEKDVLNETWEVAATNIPGANVIDFVSTQKTAGDVPLKLPKYFYGGLGVRGAAAWDPVDKVTMLTSAGADRKTGDNSKAKWVYLGGDIDGQTTGIAVLIHPSNFRFPQALRLNPKNPQICVAPSQEGDWEITPGQPYVSRYRIVIADGPANKEELERLWNDYANPPTVELGE